MKRNNLKSKSSLSIRAGNLGEKNGLTSVIKITGFRKLWIGQIFSQLADKFYIVLMVYLIAQYWINIAPEDTETLAEVASAIRINIETLAQRITLLATGIYIANTIPAIFLGSLAGVCSDRWPKIRLMVASNGLRALIVLFTPLFIIKGPIWLGVSWGYWAILVMTFLESILTQFFAPTEQATIPLLVPKQNLMAANSLYQATSMGATILGFALGEPILQLLKRIFLSFGIIGGEFLLLPFCYGMAAIIISSISLKEVQRKQADENIINELKDGLTVLRERPKVRGALLHLVVLYSLLAALYVLTISLASSIESLGPTRFGILLATTGLGITFGAIVLGEFGNHFRKKQLTATGLGVITIGLMLLGQARDSLIFTLILCALLGIGASLVAIPAQTTLQEDTPESKRGKIFGLQNNFINIALSLPLVIAGTLVGKYGIVPVLWLLASISLIAAVLEQPWKRC